jgi:hypothetical protein
MASVGASVSWFGGKKKVVAGVAGVAAAGVGVGGAQGAIVTATVSLPVDAGHPAQSLELNGDAFSDVTFEYVPETGLTLDKGSLSNKMKASYAAEPGNAGVVKALASGDSVSAAITAQSGDVKSDSGILANLASSLSGEFSTVGTRYVGFAVPVVIVDPMTLTSTTSTTYGWVSFETTDVTSQESLAGVITGYGYENTGADIAAGQTVATPEPSSLGLLAMGGAGLLAYRRRRAAR